jgi:hypothetical protein
MKTLSRTYAVAGCTALLTALAGVTAANAASVAIPAKGTLLVNGAGVSLSVSLDCAAGRDAVLFVNVAQKVDGTHVATGNTISDTVSCVAGKEKVKVDLLAVGDYAFTPGDAAVQIFLATCDTATCDAGTTVTGKVRLAR